jgi:hypothetical protein
MGDLNFRLTEGSFDGSTIANRAIKKDFSEMLAADQLNCIRKEGRSMHELSEMPIDFAPTYKLKMGKNRSGGGNDYNLKLVNFLIGHQSSNLKSYKY